MKDVLARLLTKPGIPVHSVRDLLHVLRLRSSFALLLFLLIFAGIVLGTYAKRPAFDSTAKLLMSFEGVGISLSRAEYQLGTAQVQAVEVLTSQGEILMSRTLVERVIDELGVEALRDPPPKSLLGRIIGGVTGFAGNTVQSVLVRLGLSTPMSERDALVEQLSKSLAVYPVRQSQIMEVSVRWRRPQIAQLLLDKVVQTYLQMSKDIAQGSDSYEAYAEQTKRLSAELGKAEDVLLQFKLNNSIMDLPREKQFLLTRIETLSALKAGMSDATANADAPLASGTDDNAVVSQAATLETQLGSLRVELAKLSISSTPESPAVKELQSQISEIEKTQSGVYARAAKSLVEAQTRLRTIAEVEANYARLSRDVEIASDAYQTYRKVTEDRRTVPSRTNQVNVQVIDPPSLPREPRGPARLTMLIAGLPFALLAALGLVLLINFYRNWFNNRPDNGQQP